MHFSVGKKWQQTGIQTVLYGVMGLIFYFILIGHVTPESYKDLKVGDKSPVKIVSPITVLDQAATEQARNQAAQSVEPVYTRDDSITEVRLKILDNIFSQAKAVSADQALDPAAKADLLRERLKNQIPYELSENAYQTLSSLSVESLSSMEYLTKSFVEQIMKDGIRQSDIGEAREKVDGLLVSVDLSTPVRMVTQELARLSIVANEHYDIEKTDLLRENAKKQVEEIYIYKGDILLDRNEVITEEHLRKLELVGLMDNKPVKVYAGLAMLIVLLMGMIRFYLNQSKWVQETNLSQLFMYFLILAMELIVMQIFSLGESLNYKGMGYLAPVAFGPMLIAMLIHARLAYFSSVLFALVAGLIFNEDPLKSFELKYAVVTLLGSVVGSYVVGDAQSRTKILKAGFWIVFSNLFASASFYLLSNQSINWREILYLGLFCILGGLFSGVLALGFVPFLEAAFGILSPYKLLELSNPNHPLLRKLLLEAPGTYHHSVMVANLAEASAEAIGANGLLARVGAYYHDIGKTKRPQFFIENQMGAANPHDSIPPQLSKTIILAHPYDGVKMLKEYKFPKAICDIAEQHHGTTLLVYFYQKALKEDPETRETDYRYPGPKARSKEAAIVGICDSVEATVRSMSNPTPEKIEAIVRKIIKERLDDGQFDECELTLKELDLIRQATVETLHGIFHSRIEYPEIGEVEVKGRETGRGADLPDRGAAYTPAGGTAGSVAGGSGQDGAS